MQEDIIKDIRVKCRQAMNGIVSTSMRQWGLDYKVNFGLTIQQIKDIASRLEPAADLSETLWKESTRELKIMATMLYPIDKFSKDTADKWVTEIPNQEIREQLCFNLLQELPYAEKMANLWANNEAAEVRATGYWLITRLFTVKKITETDIRSFSFIWKDITADNITLRNASLLALKRIGRQSEEMANQIIKEIADFKNSPAPLELEAYNSLYFEFSYYFEK